MKTTDIIQHLDQNKSTVFLARINGQVKTITIEHFIAKRNAADKRAVYVIGHTVVVDESDDFSVKRTEAVTVLLPFVISMAHTSTIEMRSNAMAISAQKNYIQYNY
jgi:hypothetical protein